MILKGAPQPTTDMDANLESTAKESDTFIPRPEHGSAQVKSSWGGARITRTLERPCTSAPT